MRLRVLLCRGGRNRLLETGDRRESGRFRDATITGGLNAGGKWVGERENAAPLGWRAGEAGGEKGDAAPQPNVGYASRGRDKFDGFSGLDRTRLVERAH
jgi:hypothetical protein